MTTGLDEDVVDFVPNYDDRLKEPGVLPAAFPNLLVNGPAASPWGWRRTCRRTTSWRSSTRPGTSSSTPTRTCRAHAVRARSGLPHRRAHRRPGGHPRRLRAGRGTFRTRASVKVEKIGRRQGLVVTELPYGVGPERLVEKIADNVKNKRLQGIADVTDLSDRRNGMRLVIEVKNGFNPEPCWNSSTG